MLVSIVAITSVTSDRDFGVDLPSLIDSACVSLLRTIGSSSTGRSSLKPSQATPEGQRSLPSEFLLAHFSFSHFHYSVVVLRHRLISVAFPCTPAIICFVCWSNLLRCQLLLLLSCCRFCHQRCRLLFRVSIDGSFVRSLLHSLFSRRPPCASVRASSSAGRSYGGNLGQKMKKRRGKGLGRWHYTSALAAAVVR